MERVTQLALSDLIRGTSTCLFYFHNKQSCKALPWRNESERSSFAVNMFALHSLFLSAIVNVSLFWSERVSVLCASINTSLHVAVTALISSAFNYKNKREILSAASTRRRIKNQFARCTDRMNVEVVASLMKSSMIDETRQLHQFN